MGMTYLDRRKALTEAKPVTKPLPSGVPATGEWGPIPAEKFGEPEPGTVDSEGRGYTAAEMKRARGG